MKCLLLGLILITGLAGHPSPAPIAPQRLYASTQLETAVAGVTTRVEIYVHLHPADREVGLSVEQSRRSCPDRGECHEVRMISGYTIQPAGVGDAVIDPLLDRAAVHVVINFADDVTNTVIPIRVDAVWSGVGPVRCDDPLGTPECDRFASAIIAVRSGASELIAGATGPDGILQRRPDVPTFSSP